MKVNKERTSFLALSHSGKVALLIFSALFTSSLIAEDTFYGELHIGKTQQQQSSFRKSDTSSLGFTFGYQFHENLAAEVSYFDYGKEEFSYLDFSNAFRTESIKPTSFNFGMKGILPINDKFSINAKFGLSLWNWESKSTHSQQPIFNSTSKEDGVDPYFGIGAAYKINDNMSLGLNYSVLNIDLSDAVMLNDSNYDLETTSLSLSFEF